MSDDPLLSTPEYAAAVAKADAALQRRAAVVSGHQYAPKLVWTFKPLGWEELSKLISAEGNSPLTLLKATQLSRTALDWPGAPVGAQYAYLCLVEVRATFGPTVK